ncbi:MAG: glycogen synthase GlgA [Acidobacteriota bacterium]|nr:glycogen synthase GlgA [Acidobacteriota bacterium]
MMVSSEAAPWAKSGGLADVLGALPQALAQRGHSVAVVIPRYMNALKAPAVRVGERIPVPLGYGTRGVDIWSIESDGVMMFFVDDPGLFGRDGLYGDRHGEFGDNHLRFATLCRAAIEIARRYFATDIFHCHDWQAGLVPLYLKEAGFIDPHFLGARTLMTIHNLAYRGIFAPAVMGEIGLPARVYRGDLVEFWGKISFLKAGLVYADALSTVSPQYAQEIQTPDQGEGLDGLLRARRASLTGIVNGIDTAIWNPETDRHIPGHFSAAKLDGKEICKRELLREMGLPDRGMERPLLGIISRFAYQKGFDILRQIAWEVMGNDDVYLVALGSGEGSIEEMFRYLKQHYPDRVGVRFGFDDGLAHRIEAGSDMFLMPSRYEPCGLNQMYSLRYGTAPVVRATGGLDDTVEGYPAADATGFKFLDYNGGALLHSIREACRLWEYRNSWRAMMVRGMQKDFSWTASAAEYSKLYRDLHPAGR